MDDGSGRLAASTGTPVEQPRAGWRHEATRRLLDAVYPPRCVGCGARGHWLCPRCLRQVEHLPLPLCGVCDQPVAPGAAHGCRTAAATLVSLSAIGVYDGPLRDAVHALKYNGRHGIAATLAALLAPRVAPLIAVGDLLVAVPLHPARERQRGYNQSAIVAAELARLVPLRLATTALRRVRPTADQIHMAGPEQRAANVRDAFAARPNLAHGRRVWLLDDVATTGATLRAGAQALRGAGATHVHGVVIAKTHHR